ncbi:hypothetical protein HU200_030535 [Digitaria exilis]|uniref:Uncharacterized protein n=1 Tax=Digitaria exilis TaxID=1010633 RepID=A0A835BRF3_9POAL|nr:hypothetical protein HU200_030535 [Digitaria exilis]CAB3462894.1 unnamed protein product [Digitaria exilis]
MPQKLLPASSRIRLEHFEREKLIAEGTMANGDLSRRRSQRLKDAGESEAYRMVKLKREWRALLEILQRDRIEADRKALAAAARSATPPPCDPPTGADAGAVPAGKKKRKKVVKWKVSQERIDHMILNQRDPYTDRYPWERLGKRLRRFRQLEAQRRLVDDKIFEYEQTLIKPFRQKGYAEDYSETDDDDEDN